MSDDLVTVATFMNPVQADFARAILEMDGIECRLVDETFSNVAPFYSLAIGGVKLQVRESDAPRAVAALRRKETTGKEGRADEDDT